MNFRSLKPLIPFLSMMLFAVGFLRQYIFFGYFNVPIKYFMEPSEILFLFADDLLIVFSFYILPVLIIMFFWGDKIGQSNLARVEKRARQNFFRRVFNADYFSLFFASGCLIYSTIRSSNYSSTLTGISSTILTLLPVILQEVKIKYDKATQSEFPPAYNNLIIVTLMFINGVICFTMWDARNIEKGKYFGTKIETSKSEFVSDSTNIYIGRTSNYIFFHNKRTNGNTIISAADVSKIELLRN